MNLPQVGLGTMGIDSHEPIVTALETGYRHLDTARIYDNESIVGKGLTESGTSREEVILATKLWTNDLAAANVRPATRQSMLSLGVEQIDLVYVHRPRGEYQPHTTLPAMERLVEDEVVSEIGVSNFRIEDLDHALEILDIPIAAHQTEFHPLYYNQDLIQHARQHNYKIVAYSPLIGGRVKNIEPIVKIAESHQVTPEEVAIAWVTTKDPVVTIPKASKKHHLQANIEAINIELSQQEIATIDSIERTKELYPD